MEANALFNEAIQKLREANDELCRPEEDVVSSMVCSNSQYAIRNYLKGFLALNGTTPKDEESIESLYEQCKSINEHFEEVDLSGCECRDHKDESRFRNAATRFSHCFDIADSLDTFLRRERIIA